MRLASVAWFVAPCIASGAGDEGAIAATEPPPVGAPANSTTLARRSLDLETGFAQFRDELNVGLVYHGGQLGVGYGRRHAFGQQSLGWSVRTRLGLWSTRGLLAATLQLELLDVDYVFSVYRGPWSLWLGPGLDSDLRWYVNPELHSGSFYWYGHYDLELRGYSTFALGRQAFQASLRTAVYSVVSRPGHAPDPYFYNWTFADLVGRTHRQPQVGSLNLVRHIEAGVEWRVPNRKLGLGYTFRFEDYARAPALRSVQHTVRLSWH